MEQPAIRQEVTPQGVAIIGHGGVGGDQLLLVGQKGSELAFAGGQVGLGLQETELEQGDVSILLIVGNLGIPLAPAP